MNYLDVMETLFCIEGLALEAHKRIQVNVHMKPNPYLSVLQNVKEVCLVIENLKFEDY